MARCRLWPMVGGASKSTTPSRVVRNARRLVAEAVEVDGVITCLLSIPVLTCLGKQLLDEPHDLARRVRLFCVARRAGPVESLRSLMPGPAPFLPHRGGPHTPGRRAVRP